MTELALAQGRRTATGCCAWLQEYGVYAGVAAAPALQRRLHRSLPLRGELPHPAVQVAPVLIVALGMALVIGTEGVDLSVGSVMALSAALLPLYLGYGPWAASRSWRWRGPWSGCNGVRGRVRGVQPIVATLALLVAGRGLALVLSGGQLKECEPG
jgi:ribose/xylose/arabinose/galactoside ABC-type transport system permease subunit